MSHSEQRRMKFFEIVFTYLTLQFFFLPTASILQLFIRIFVCIIYENTLLVYIHTPYVCTIKLLTNYTIQCQL